MGALGIMDETASAAVTWTCYAPDVVTNLRYRLGTPSGKLGPGRRLTHNSTFEEFRFFFFMSRSCAMKRVV